MIIRLLRCSHTTRHHEKDGIYDMRCHLPFWHVRWGNSIHLTGPPTRSEFVGPR